MNIPHLLMTQLIALFSLMTASGVLIHDTNIDKAMTSAMYKKVTDFGSDTNAQVRTSSNPHPHAGHMSVVKDQGDVAKTMPRSRDRKRAATNKRVAQGYHGNGVCLPLAGEWI